MTKKGQHVVPNKEGGWSVRRTGAPKVTKSFGSRREAVRYARDLAKKQSSELYIHSKDGTIRDADSYGSDPFPPRDNKR